MRIVVLSMLCCACGAPQVNALPADTVADASTSDSSVAAAVDCSVAPMAYTPVPAWSGRAANLPEPPVLAVRPIQVGGAYTVFGATHHLGSSLHVADVTGKPISIVGYIVSSNLASAPRCALHHTGIADPKGCVTPIPSFTIADGKGDSSGPTIAVMGWASNFANVFEAYEKYKKLSGPPAQLYQDELWATGVPYPLPSVGAKVKVTGRYGVNFSRSSTGLTADPVNGIMTVDAVEYLEPAPQPAKL
jgi:hypothetical protein